MSQICFTSEECDIIISLSEELQKHHSSEWWMGDKTDYFAWHIEKNEGNKGIFDRITLFLDKRTNFILLKDITTIHLQNVKEGNGFEPHIDKHSEYNIGVCLNTEYEGGELICHDHKLYIPKIKGLIYSFYGTQLHEVKKVLSGERWSLIAFLDNTIIERKKGLI